MKIEITVKVSETYQTLEACDITVEAPKLNPAYFRDLVADCVNATVNSASAKQEAKKNRPNADEPSPTPMPPTLIETPAAL